MKSILSIVIGASLACCAIEASAEEPTFQKVQLDIARQSLNDALNTWADQTGYQLVCLAPEIALEFVAPKVKGAFTAMGALQQLLEGTPLVYEVTSERTVTVKARFTAASQTTGYLDRVDVPRLQIAALGAADDGNARLAQSDPGRSKDTTAPGSQNTSPESGDVEELEEVVVTGTHIRGASAVSQVVSITRQEIERTGYTTVQSLVESLPQNFGGVSADGRFALEGGSSLARRNSDRASSIDLRGLGAQSTLTLVDGMRYAGSVGGRVFDVSTIPLAMIERVDVVTGGYSAIYGSDAVAGVVNLIPRRRFDGAQTELSYGGADEGGERLQFSQLLGSDFPNGGIALGYDYSREWSFDLADADLLLTQPTPASGGLLRTSLQAQPDSRRHSGFVSGHLNYGQGGDLYGSAVYTDKSFDERELTLQPGASTESAEVTQHPSSLYAVNVGTDFSISDAWALNGNVSHSASDIESHVVATTNLATSSSTLNLFQNDKSAVSAATAVLNGRLFKLGDDAVHLAIGAEFRREDFRSRQIINQVESPPTSNDRTVRSAFAEMLFPILRESDVFAAKRLELSVAGRYDDYSDFGDTFNPQFGLLWEPLSRFYVRGSYSRAFRAPALVELNNASFVQLRSVLDPQSATGRTPLMIVTGDNPDLDAERADTWTAGVEFKLPGASISVTYFDVDYTDRIEIPAPSNAERLSALVNEARYTQLISRGPSRETAQGVITAGRNFFNLTGVPFNPATQNVLDVFPQLAIFDDRSNNIAVEDVSGIDFAIRGTTSKSFGEIVYGMMATYILDHERSITITSPIFSLVNEVGKPVDLRARANLGWSNGLFGVFGYLNYTDGYANPYSVPVSSIPSLTTLDLMIQLDLSERGSGVLQGLVGTISVENVLDETPPRFENGVYGARYDPANAGPFGRFVSLRLVKRW